MPFEIKEVSKNEDFNSLSVEWTTLITELPHISFFLTWEWLNTWWHTFATEHDQLNIILVKKDQKLIAIFPLYRQNKNTLRFIGTGEKEVDEVATEYLDIICSKELVIPVSKLLALHLKTSKLNFVFNNYLEESTIELFITDLSSSHWHNTAICGVSYRAKLTRTLQTFTNQCSKSLIKRLSRAKKKFHLELNGKIESYHTPEKLNIGFEILKNLHSQRWQSKNKNGVFGSEQFLAFHKTFTQQAIKNNWLKIDIMYANNIAIAAIYSIEYKNSCYFYQSGVKDNFKPNISPGYLMHLLQIESAIEKELLYYDYMKGSIEKSYKSKLSNDKRFMYNTTLIKKSFKHTLTWVKWQAKQLRDALL